MHARKADSAHEISWVLTLSPSCLLQLLPAQHGPRLRPPRPHSLELSCSLRSLRAHTPGWCTRHWAARWPLVGALASPVHASTMSAAAQLGGEVRHGTCASGTSHAASSKKLDEASHHKSRKGSSVRGPPDDVEACKPAWQQHKTWCGELLAERQETYNWSRALRHCPAEAKVDGLTRHAGGQDEEHVHARWRNGTAWWRCDRQRACRCSVAEHNLQV